MKKQKFMYACVKFNNAAWGTRCPENRLEYVETKLFKSWKGVNNLLNTFLGEDDFKDSGNQFIYRSSKAIEIIRTTR